MDDKMIQLEGLYERTSLSGDGKLRSLAVGQLLSLANLSLLLVNGAGLRETETGKKIVAKLEEIERAAEF